MWHPEQGQVWPQGHNLNTFGRGLIDDVIYKMDKIFENVILKTYFFVRLTGTVWTTLIKIQWVVLEEDVWMKKVDTHKNKGLSQQLTLSTVLRRAKNQVYVVLSC